jgi:hypothetical protein
MCHPDRPATVPGFQYTHHQISNYVINPGRNLRPGYQSGGLPCYGHFVCGNSAVKQGDGQRIESLWKPCQIDALIG